MTDTALMVSEQRALTAYSEREEVRELADRLLNMHPAATEVGAAGMRAAAQLALLLGANPLPGVNEVHIWKDNKGRTCMSLGVNYWRRKAQEWGGILWQCQPRAMRPDEAKEYGIPQGITASICRGVRADDMLRFRAAGFATNEIWAMCGATGVGTVGANEYAKQGRPLIWTANKRAETDLLRQLFPAQFSQISGQLAQAPVTVLPIEEDEPDPELEQPRRYTLADANRDLFGTDTDEDGQIIQGEVVNVTPAAAQPPAPKANGRPAANDPGPLPDDELTISETEARAFVVTAAALLETDTDTLKTRLHALGYTAIPGKAAERVAAYRRLRADLGAADDIMQPALVTVAPDTANGGGAYQD